MAGKNPFATGSGLRASDVLLLGVAASFRPLGVMARNPVGIVHPERLVALILAVWAASVATAWLLTKLGGDRSTVVGSVFVAMTLLMSGGALLREYGAAVGWLITLVIVAVTPLILARLEESTFVTAALVTMAVALMSGVLLSYLDRPPVGIDTVVESAPIDLELTETPNIYLVVFDAYSGLVALQIDAGADKTELRNELERRGFQVPASVWSSYWSTQLSIPSLLDMSYPLVGPSGGQVTKEKLYQMIGGDVRLVEILKANGYETVMIESGWSGSSCGSEFDRCVASPFYDEAMFWSTWDTVAGPYLLSWRGYPFTVAAVHTMEWLLDPTHAPDATDRPLFVFAHLVVPHPPFYLSEDCEVTVDDQREGVSFYQPGVPHEKREAFFAEQVACLDLFMTRLADRVSDDDVVVFVSDHGTDRRNQLVERTGWSPEAIIERMNVFAAVRTGRTSCDVGDFLVIPNLMRRVLSCFAASPLEDLPGRILVPEMELDPQAVEALLAGEIPPGDLPSQDCQDPYHPNSSPITGRHTGIVERMNVVAAVRIGRQCNVGDSLVTPNLIRRMLSFCALSTLEDHPPRIFPGHVRVGLGQVLLCGKGGIR